MIHDALIQWVIYDHPRDHPDVFVARRWLISPRGIDNVGYSVADTLDEARLIVQRHAPGSVRLDRSPDDDPTIVEVWT